MEIDNEKRLKTLIEAITHSGSNTLNESVFKQVKKICKSSQDYIPVAYESVLKQLKKKNSQIRLAAFQICKELFTRSVLFRDHVINDLQLIFELCAEINSNKKLPPPKSSADSLKVLAISTLKKWVEEFGETHKKLKVAFNYLQKCKQINFETLEVRNSAEQAIQNEQDRHKRAVNTEKIKKIMEEYNSSEPEIQTTITELSNCITLLLPTPEDFFILDSNLKDSTTNLNNFSNENPRVTEEEEDESEHLGNKNELRELGLFPNYSITLQLQPEEKFKIPCTEENSSIIENAKDCIRIINNRFLPMVKKWAKVYSKCLEGGSIEIKKIIDLKEKLESILKKYYSLNIDEKKLNGEGDSSSDDDDTFEEVRKEGYEDSVDFSKEDFTDYRNIEKLKPKVSEPSKSSVNSLPKRESYINAPSTSGTSTSAELDRKKKLLAVAPKLPFDIDLLHWEDEHLKPPTLISTKIDVDKFWGSCESDDIHEIPNPEGVASLRTRVIEFTGKFEPVKWTCRAPLPNGSLCPRKDRYKCPFHGKIVARDETGKCQNPEDEKIAEKSTGECSTADWQDPSLLQDIQAATGIDLKMPEKKGKRKKSGTKNLTHKKMKTSAAALRIVESKKLPGLVDVVRKQNNSYTRLCKKIFNRSSLKRVSSVLNKLDKNKYRDKFGDQFNYS